MQHAEKPKPRLRGPNPAKLIVSHTPLDGFDCVWASFVSPTNSEGDHPTINDTKIAVKQHRILQVQQLRKNGKTCDLTATVVVWREVQTEGNPILELQVGHIAPWGQKGVLWAVAPFAAILADRMWSAETHAVVCICDSAEAQRSLLRSRATPISTEEAYRLSKALGDYVATQRHPVWLFPEVAIRPLLSLAYDAMTEEGYLYESKGKKLVHVFIRNFACEIESAKDLVKAMAFGKPLTVDIVSKIPRPLS